MYYYEIYINYGHGGYSLAVKSETPKTDEEIKTKLTELNLFEESSDINNIEYINQESIELENHFHDIKLI